MCQSEIMAYITTNPYTNEVVARFADLDDAQLEALVTQAADTFETWSRTSFAERRAIMKKAASLLREQADQYAALLTLEMGKLAREAQGEVRLSADILDYYADNAERFLAPVPLTEAQTETMRPMIVSDPIGVLLAVEPWNFPYYQLARVAGPQLMAGNTVVVKHSSIVPQCAAAFDRLFRDAGAPDGAYTNLFATRDQLNRLIEDPRIAAVCLTGGERSGGSVASRAGKSLKKTTLELGGADAFIVLDDADLDKTVKWAVWGRLNNGGQCCVASKRFIVAESIADAFIAKFKEALDKLVAGDPRDPATTLPPMSSQGAADELNEQVRQAVAHGARPLYCGAEVPKQGAFVRATILTDVARDNPAYFQEFFGPVAMVFRVGSDEEAIALANDSEFGLGGSVFTRDEKRGVAVARQVRTGMVFINHPTWTAPELPFGGIKKSGYGRELSGMGIDEFVNKKLINVVNIDAP